MKCIECGAESGESAVCKECAAALERIRRLIKAYWALGVPQVADGGGRERNA